MTPPHVCEAVDAVFCSWYFWPAWGAGTTSSTFPAPTCGLCGDQTVRAHSACGRGAERMSWEPVRIGHRPRPHALPGQLRLAPCPPSLLSGPVRT